MLAQTALLALAAMATTALADTGIQIVPTGNVGLSLSDGTVLHAGQPLLIHNAGEVTPWIYESSSLEGQTPFCKLDIPNGVPTDTQVTFYMNEGPAFLQPCGYQDGIRVICTNPESQC